MLAKVRRLLRRAERPDGVGLFLFDEVSQALRAERVLRFRRYLVRLVAPPVDLEAGCDLAVAIAAIERPGAERALAAENVLVRGWADGSRGMRPLASLVTAVDFGEHVMVRAGNVKITVEKATGVIVNTSGVGCPDVPHLDRELVGRTLSAAPRPRDLGYTLCGLMLDRAFHEARARFERERAR